MRDGVRRRRSGAERAVVVLIATACAAACGPETRHIARGSASGTIACDIFVYGGNPPDIGDGVALVSLGDASWTIAQGAAAFAVDANGAQVADPAQASYFGAQIFQFVSPTRMEVFEIRVIPADWVAGDVVLDGSRAAAFFGRVDFDDNGNAVSAAVLGASTKGTLHLDAAGRNPGDPVKASFADIQLSAE